MRQTNLTPLAKGFTMPAEWEHQAGILLSYPLNPVTWERNRSTMEMAYADFAGAVSKYEKVFINCVEAMHENVLKIFKERDANLENIVLINIETNDAWCRDHGPVRLVNRATSERAFVDFSYNSWGGKFPPWALDDAVPRKIAEYFKIKRFNAPFICEGGALETNGAGTLLTTRSVILNENRNSDMTEEKAEKLLCDYLGMEQILWLDSGLYCDDTDGHIDTLTRFVNKNTVLTCRDHDKASVNHASLEKNYSDLKNMRLKDGSGLNIIELPMPNPIYPETWREEMLPATYANFLIINGAVIVPSYRSESTDARAAAIIGEAFPGYDVISIDCSDIILEGGALHCLSQQL